MRSDGVTQEGLRGFQQKSQDPTISGIEDGSTDVGERSRRGSEIIV
jgi:hypothetical protein